MHDALIWLGIAAALVSVIDRAAFQRLPRRLALALYVFFLVTFAVALLKD